MKKWKLNNMKEAEEQVILLEDEGVDVIRHTDYHWKINGLDVWISSKKFMGKDKKVRTYNNLLELNN